MRTLSILVASLALLSVAAHTEARRIVIPDLTEQYNQQIAALTEQLQRAKLGQIAIFVDSRSEGTDKLVIKSGASGTPTVGKVMRQPSWGDIPIISVYPTSSPVSLKLEGVGECEVLGAVALLTKTYAAECDDKDMGAAAEPGVYLIAYHMTEGWLAEVVLVSLTVDDEGRVRLDPAIRTLAKQGWNVSSLAPPAAVVKFPEADAISVDNPIWRASVTIICPEHMYEFALDPRIAWLEGGDQ